MYVTSLKLMLANKLKQVFWSSLSQFQAAIYTPLHRASQGGNVMVARYLVNEMSKHTPLKDVVYDRTKNGNSPLHLATLYGH